MKLLFISDLHIGGGGGADDFGNRDDDFLKWIDKITPDKIYLVGDIYELWQFKMKNIKKAHSKLCDFFKANMVEYVKGNHDFKLLGKNEIKLKFGKIKMLITHGHQNDKRMSNPFIRGLVWVVGMIERIPGMSWVDNSNKFSKKKSSIDIMTEKYVNKRIKKFSIMICGHTHIQIIKDKRHGRIYANTGTCINGKFQGITYDTKKNKLDMV